VVKKNLEIFETFGFLLVKIRNKLVKKEKKPQNLETAKKKKKKPWFGQVIKTCRHIVLNPFWDDSQ
jgi:hypothetical protein